MDLPEKWFRKGEQIVVWSTACFQIISKDEHRTKRPWAVSLELCRRRSFSILPSQEIGSILRQGLQALDAVRIRNSIL